jgi:CRISPR-associated exonuclease Cas4
MTTATHITYLHLCHRKLWLFHQGIQMEYNSEAVAEGKFIGETTYEQRAEKYTEIALEGIKIDYFDAKNKVVHEVKKSDKMEAVHIAQVKYYLFVLEENGILGATGVIEYPKLREKLAVELTAADRIAIPTWRNEVLLITENPKCPPTINKPFCKQCAYYDFCYVEEE